MTVLEHVLQRVLAPGLVAVLHIGLHHPRFDSSTITHLTDPLGGAAVCSSLAADLPGSMWRNLPLRQLLCASLGIAAEPEDSGTQGRRDEHLPDALWHDEALRAFLCARLGIDPARSWMP
jgi:hypothetical protein